MEQEVIEIIAKYLNLNPESIKPEDELRSITTDSLDWIEIIMKLEDEFDIKIPDRDIDTLITIQGIANYINHQVSNTEGVER